ncbi:MAG: TolC family protein [Phycisphaerae bacterium]|nr:TolC family protein [Phycisphaerae bacterium]
MRTILLVTIIVSIVLTGCSKKTAQDTMPSPRPLGADVSTFKAPALKDTGDLPQKEEFQKPDLVDPNGVINLTQALALALLENPDLKSFSWQVRASQAAQLQASLKPNPQVSLVVGDFGGSGALSGFDGYESTLSVSQLIEVADKRQKRTQVASLEKKIADWDYESKRLDVFTDVIKAYTDVLSAQQRVDLDGELLRLSEELVQTVSGRVEAGKDAPLDEINARIVLSNIDILYHQANNELDFARSQLASLWSAAPKFKKVEGVLEMPSEIPPLEKITGYLDENPQVARWSVEVEKAKAAYRLEKARGKQDVTVSGGVKRVELENSNALIVGVTIPIGINNRNQGARQQAMYQYAKTLQQQKAVRNKLETDLAGFYKEMANAFTEAKELKDDLLPAAKNVFQASKTGYRQGKLDYLNVLNSQRILFLSMSRHVEALRSYHKAKAEVERLTATPIKPLLGKQKPEAQAQGSNADNKD